MWSLGGWGVLKGDRHHIWNKHFTLCGCVCVYVCVCVCVSEAGGTVRLYKQAACYFLAAALPETLEALSEAPRHHLEVVSKRKAS